MDKPSYRFFGGWGSRKKHSPLGIYWQDGTVPAYVRISEFLRGEIGFPDLVEIIFFEKKDRISDTHLT